MQQNQGIWQYPQWVCFKLIWNDKRQKWDKIPYNAMTGKMAKTDTLATWTSYKNAVAAVARLGMSGIGFVFTNNDPFTGIDIDGCRNKETGELNQVAIDILSMFPNCYVEISPSGTGIHIIIVGKLPPGAKHTVKKYGLEVYDQLRFFTYTGDLLPGAVCEFRDCQNELDFFYNKYFAKPELVQRPQLGCSLSDNDLVNKILQSKQSLEFQALYYHGDTSRYGGDDSAADLALANILAFWCGRDAGKMDSIFRQSRLYRGKWDERHYSNGMTYGQATIQRAINDCKQDYDPAYHRKVTITVPAQEKEVGKTNKPVKIICECFTEEGQFLPPVLAEAILRSYQFAYEFEQFFVYLNGVYRKTEARYVQQICLDALGERYRDNRGSEVAKYIMTKLYSPDGFFQVDTNLINVSNGLLDWQTGEIYNHSCEYHSNIQIPVLYDPAAQCPAIDKFFADVLPIDCLEIVWEIFGYFLIPDTKMQKAFMLKSNGESGKSVFLSLLQAFLGKDNYSSEALQPLSENRFRTANLVGKLANICADIPNSTIENSSIFKALVTGDELAAERKNKNPFSFKNAARLIFSCNEMPSTKDVTHGFSRRWVILEFPNTFKEGDPRRDPYLLDKLITSTELSGLLNKSIEGLKRLTERGEFKLPDSAAKALREYILDNDSAKEFLSEHYEVSHEESRVSRSWLYAQYKNYCTENGLECVSAKKFVPKLRELFPNAKEVMIKGDRLWKGIEPKIIGST